MTRPQATRSKHTRLQTVALVLFIIGLLIVFRDVPVVHSFLNFLGALFNLLLAVLGLSNRSAGGSSG